MDKALNITDETFDKVLTKYDLVLVDFWAPWCGPCVRLSPTIDELAKIYTGSVAIAKLNIDENSVAPTKYNVKSIPTLLVFQQGKLVEQWLGVRTKTAICAVLDTYIKK